MKARLRCGDVGVPLVLILKTGGVARDISGALTREVTIYRPDGTTVTRSATFVTDGTDGYLQLLTIATDTAPGGNQLPGRYRYRGRVADNLTDLNSEDGYFWAEAV